MCDSYTHYHYYKPKAYQERDNNSSPHPLSTSLSTNSPKSNNPELHIIPSNYNKTWKHAYTQNLKAECLKATQMGEQQQQPQSTSFLDPGLSTLSYSFNSNSRRVSGNTRSSTAGNGNGKNNSKTESGSDSTSNNNDNSNVHSFTSLESPSKAAQEMSKPNSSASNNRSRCGRKGNTVAKRRHESDLKKAIILVVMNNYSLRQAATATGVSHETLRRRLLTLKLRRINNNTKNANANSTASASNNNNNNNNTNNYFESQSAKPLYESKNIFENNQQSAYPLLSASSTTSNNYLQDSHQAQQHIDPRFVDSSDLGNHSGMGIINTPISQEPAYNSRQVSKLINSIENFEKAISKDSIFQAPELRRRIDEEFAKVKSSTMGYIYHTVEALQTARMMILDEIEQNEGFGTSGEMDSDPSIFNGKSSEENSRMEYNQPNQQLLDHTTNSMGYSISNPNQALALSAFQPSTFDPKHNQAQYEMSAEPIMITKHQEKQTDNKAGSIYNLIHSQNQEEEVTSPRKPSEDISTRLTNNSSNNSNDNYNTIKSNNMSNINFQSIKNNTYQSTAPQGYPLEQQQQQQQHHQQQQQQLQQQPQQQQLQQQPQQQPSSNSRSFPSKIRGSHVPIMALLSEDD